MEKGKRQIEARREDGRTGLNKRQMGAAKEKLAGKLLTLHGYEILEHNYRCRSGEVDIIAREGGDLVFVEVKYRSDDEALPQEAVDHNKQRHICRVARQYCYRNNYQGNCRFDVVAIRGQQYQIIRDAFEYCL